MNSIDSLINAIKGAKSIVLSTHKSCDGDGLGAQIGLYHALCSLGKNVRILNVDATPQKYHFLKPDLLIQQFEGKHEKLNKTDLSLILDTNDRRLVSPLYEELEKQCAKIIFIDHHPILEVGPSPTTDSYIQENAASTGEIAFQIIKHLGVPLNKDIARAIYTSIAFDTQLFRYVRNSPNSHLIAAELLEFETDPAEIHRFLFATHSIGKVRFLSKALEKIEYYFGGQIALLVLEPDDFIAHGMTAEDSRDLIDIIMNVDTLVAGAMIRLDPNGEKKISIRSKGKIEVLEIAESLGGGGHLYASGATTQDDLENLKKDIIQKLTELIQRNP